MGGDYYDVLPLGGTAGRHLLCVADISGKGLPAALLMSNIQATLRAITRTPVAARRAGHHDERAAVRQHAVESLRHRLPARLRPASGACVYVNGGHNDGIVLRRDGPVELLTTTGLPVGMFAKAAYEEGRVQLWSRAIC